MTSSTTLQYDKDWNSATTFLITCLLLPGSREEGKLNNNFSHWSIYHWFKYQQSISSFMHANRSKMVFCPQMGGPLYKTTWATLPPPSQQGDVISFALWHLLHVWHFFLLGHFYHIFVLSANIIVGFGVFLSFFAFVISYFCFLLRFFTFWHSLQTVWKKIGSNWRSGSLGQTCLSHNYPSHDST